jgi:hypothetical protein
MKTEDELLIELRDGLAALAASKATMQPVNARDFPLVDLKFYDDVAARLVNYGCTLVGDFVVVTGHPSDGSLRCFARAFLTSDGTFAAACYHPRPRFWIGLISRIVCGRLGKVVEAETEFSDDTWIMTTTAPKARLFDPPPLFLREHHADGTPIETLLEWHKAKVGVYLEAHPGVTVRTVSDMSGLERAQSRQHDIAMAYRKQVGGLTADELRRFSFFGRKRSAVLKARLQVLTDKMEAEKKFVAGSSQTGS